MTNECPCGRPIPDTAALCPHCGYLLDASLAELAAFRGLAYELDVALTRQARIGGRDGSRPAETPIAYDERIAKVTKHLRDAMTEWASIIVRGTGAEPPPPGLAQLAAWLRRHVGWIRYHEDALDAYTDITDGVRDARRAIDRPADKLYAGPCDECGEDLYASLDASYVVCHNTEGHASGDEWVWEVTERRRWLLDSARDVLASGTEISRALTRYAQPVTPSALRGYVHRGALIARGERIEGGRMVMLYRLGDVLDILARQAERVAS